jgi:hypothetical protein
MHIVSWLPHGRSWKIFNRDMFTEIALPRYFGHKNYASFVRIVNAWGFRRVTSGLDRDSYYHEVSKCNWQAFYSRRMHNLTSFPTFLFSVWLALPSRKTRTSSTHETPSNIPPKDPSQ